MRYSGWKARSYNTWTADIWEVWIEARDVVTSRCASSAESFLFERLISASMIRCFDVLSCC